MPVLLLGTAFTAFYSNSPLISANSEEQNSNFFLLPCEAFFFTSAFAEILLNGSDGVVRSIEKRP
jgi:hypothetical protein